VEKAFFDEDVLKKYFTAEQLDQLAQRREQLGEEAITEANAEWSRLVASLQAELEAGTDPAEPRVQELARRWTELLESSHGGDPRLRDSLIRMYSENLEQAQNAGGPSPELVEYVKRANAVAAR
jgi:hypothetical protein